jgi:hypothetical protein
MEIKESVVIGFLLVVIIILIFSNISVSFGASEDDSNSNGTSGKTAMPTNKITPGPTKFDPIKSDLLSNDIKKQLKELDAMYYSSTCKI